MRLALVAVLSASVALFLVGCAKDSDSSGTGGMGGAGGEAGAGAEGGSGGVGGEMMGGAGGAGATGGAGGAGATGGMEPAAPTVTSIEATPATLSGLPGHTAALTATATWSDDRTEDVSAQIEWTSSDEAVVTIAEQTATVIAAGMATITGTYGEQTVTISVEGIACDYPANDGTVAFGAVFPELKWDTAYRADGTQAPFSLYDFYCSPEYADKTTLIVDLGAGWCGPCTHFTQNILNPIAEDLVAMGAEILYLEAQDTNFELSDSRFAFRHIGEIIGEGPGIRVGDKDTLIRDADGSWREAPAFVQQQDIVTGYPSVWVLRKRDMTMIADQGRSNFYLPFELIVADPEADWSDPPPPPFRSNCLEGEEEASEPNDTAQDAARIEVGTYDGGICAREPDFYRFVINGPWRATLQFDSTEGDLDMYVYNKRTESPLLDENGRAIGSNGTGDVEVVEHSGPAILTIFGYNSSSANYTLTIEEL